jgi:hypothetical protein
MLSGLVSWLARCSATTLYPTYQLLKHPSSLREAEGLFAPQTSPPGSWTLDPGFRAI